MSPKAGFFTTRCFLKDSLDPSNSSIKSAHRGFQMGRKRAKAPGGIPSLKLTVCP